MAPPGRDGIDHAGFDERGSPFLAESPTSFRHVSRRFIERFVFRIHLGAFRGIDRDIRSMDGEMSAADRGRQSAVPFSQ